MSKSTRTLMTGLAIALLMLAGCGDDPAESKPVAAAPAAPTAASPNSAEAMTKAKEMLVAMRQSLEKTGMWEGDGFSVSAEKVTVEPDGTLVLGSLAANRGVKLERADPASGEVAAQILARSIRYLALDTGVIELRLEDAKVLQPDGQTLDVDALHMQLSVAEAVEVSKPDDAPAAP